MNVQLPRLRADAVAVSHIAGLETLALRALCRPPRGARRRWRLASNASRWRRSFSWRRRRASRLGRPRPEGRKSWWQCSSASHFSARRVVPTTTPAAPFQQLPLHMRPLQRSCQPRLLPRSLQHARRSATVWRARLATTTLPLIVGAHGQRCPTRPLLYSGRRWRQRWRHPVADRQRHLRPAVSPTVRRTARALAPQRPCTKCKRRRSRRTLTPATRPSGRR